MPSHQRKPNTRGSKNRDGMRDMRNIEGEIRDENILAGSGCAHFNWWDAR